MFVRSGTAAAYSLETITAVQWMSQGFGAATFGGVSWTVLETGTLVLATHAVAYGAVSLAWAGGAAVGSLISAAPTPAGITFGDLIGEGLYMRTQWIREYNLSIDRSIFDMPEW